MVGTDSRPRNPPISMTVGSLLPLQTSAVVGLVIGSSSLEGDIGPLRAAAGKSTICTSQPNAGAQQRRCEDEVYRAATTSFAFMSIVMVHPEVPRNSNGAGFGPRR